MFIGKRVVTAMLLITIKLTANFYRAPEYRGVSNLTGKRLKNVKDSAVSDHLLQCNYTIDFDQFDILANDVRELPY